MLKVCIFGIVLKVFVQPLHQRLNEYGLDNHVPNHIVDALVNLLYGPVEVVTKLLEDVEPFIDDTLQVCPGKPLEHLADTLAHIVLQFVNLVLDFNHLIAIKRKTLP